MALNDIERNALNKKMDAPNVKVICPRCGAEIAYMEKGTAIVIACMTVGCIKKSLRGI